MAGADAGVPGADAAGAIIGPIMFMGCIIGVIIWLSMAGLVMGAIIGAIMFMGCIMEPIAGTIGAIMPIGADIIGPIGAII